MDEFLSKYQCNFRKGLSVQNYLLAMQKTSKEAVENSQAFGALLTNLLKAFDFLPHELFIAKLNFYGFSTKKLEIDE